MFIYYYLYLMVIIYKHQLVLLHIVDIEVLLKSKLLGLAVIVSCCMSFTGQYTIACHDLNGNFNDINGERTLYSITLFTFIGTKITTNY